MAEAIMLLNSGAFAEEIELFFAARLLGPAGEIGAIGI
jgi:hypothetical protein